MRVDNGQSGDTCTRQCPLLSTDRFRGRSESRLAMDSADATSALLLTRRPRDIYSIPRAKHLGQQVHRDTHVIDRTQTQPQPAKSSMLNVKKRLMAVV